MSRIEDIPLVNLKAAVDSDGIATVSLARAAKRNALDAATVEELVALFSALPRSGVRAVLLRAEGDHFCAGLDLVEHFNKDHSAADFMHLCLRWHEAFNKMEYSGVPIIAALKGAVVGGGLELASAAHIRVADRSTYFALPEGQRGLFTGGGATIRVADLVGKVALERGPVVYAFEHVDNDADVFDTTLSDSAEFEAVHMTDLLGGVTIIRGTSTHNATKIMAIPYYAWGHRGVGKMTVWVHRSED